MAQLTDDCFAHGGRLMRTDEALELLKEKLECVTSTETLATGNCLGRVLREDIIAPGNIPPHDNSAVDGYAIYFDDLEPEGPTRLRIAGRQAAGQTPVEPPLRGEALRIFTGAVMPEGPDTVMMQEDCALEDGDVIIPAGIKRGANRRDAGEDVRAGSRVLHSGQRLRAQDLGQAAAVGRSELQVSRPLRVALFSTGDELREPGQDLVTGAIHDSNRYTLNGLLKSLGCEVSDLGILRDNAETIISALDKATEDHDLVITSGGVSVGEEDHVKHAVETLGKMHAWRLAIKPGRPIALGQIGAIPFVGLPGNPVAVVVTYLVFVRPMLLRLMGGNITSPQSFPVRADFSYRKKKERREWVRASLRPNGDGSWKAEKFPRDGAGILSSLVESQGLVELPEDLTQVEPGMLVDYLPFSEVIG
ncbi:gephyrin-like molybdotransferase Glp [Denitrobaculum tricleocarpae]|uniref:Molybdopterin molybdenumtransferase n=1 Tax=Denitrobaculum tricleocarpae TaxID=2591009 RepID=A0A545U280_9PROT|nr:gephyrin-like molybdotransferase Glp [Denitrobaculum tricleocarpae]TQV83568.1 molybdopterin molybdotransferase MoeA [Denitrobaculum tricleocarpae]